MDDDNASRIAPRSYVDPALRDDLFHADKHCVGLRVSAIHAANHCALYNFLSTVSGTHYVSPRAVTGELAHNLCRQDRTVLG